MPDLYKFAEKTTTEDMLNYSMPCTAVIISLCIKFFSPSCQKAKFRKKIINICPEFSVQFFFQLIYSDYAYFDKQIHIKIFCSEA
jgi:hypothetical protein